MSMAGLGMEVLSAAVKADSRRSREHAIVGTRYLTAGLLFEVSVVRPRTSPRTDRAYLIVRPARGEMGNELVTRSETARGPAAGLRATPCVGRGAGGRRLKRPAP